MAAGFDTAAIINNHMLESLTIDHFTPLLQTQFVIHFTQEASHNAVLKRISPWGEPSDKYRQPFTLEFETDLSTHYYPQGVYRLIHPSLGQLDLFMVPVGLGSSGMCYEIVIS